MRLIYTFTSSSKKTSAYGMFRIKESFSIDYKPNLQLENMFEKIAFRRNIFKRFFCLDLYL